MLNDGYDVKVSADVETFEFDSIDSRGTIRKVVRYIEINIKGFYNIGFLCI